MSNPFVLAVMTAFRGKLPRPPDQKPKQKDKAEQKSKSRTRAYREG